LYDESFLDILGQYRIFLSMKATTPSQKQQHFDLVEVNTKIKRATRLVVKRLQRLRAKYGTIAFDELWAMEQLGFATMNGPVHYSQDRPEPESATGLVKKIHRHGVARTLKTVLDITKFCESSIVKYH
jgi:hypothetical protein